MSTNQIDLLAVLGVVAFVMLFLIMCQISVASNRRQLQHSEGRQPKQKRQGWWQVRRMTTEVQRAEGYIDSIFDDAKARMTSAIEERSNLES